MRVVRVAKGEGMAKRVLIVDDHAPTRVLIKTILEAERTEQFSVAEAATGTDCLKAFDTQGPFDLILLDVNLPDMDGYSVCRALRHVDATVPIVFVTAKGDLRDYAAGREAGGDSYLVKPIARAALRSIVNLFTSIERMGRPGGS
jgi:DNA-binding response OmpR family regulator